MKYRIVERKDGFYIEKGWMFYYTIKGPFPTKGDAQSWININVQ